MTPAVPPIKTWTQRELVSADTMNAGIRDVHEWLARPPAIRLKGSRAPIAASTYALLPFQPPGPWGTYASAGMTVAKTDGMVWGLKAPLTGRYRLTIGATMTAASGAAASRDTWIYAAVNAHDSGQAVADNATVAYCPVAVSSFTHMGSHTVELRLHAEDVVRLAGRMEGSAVTFADTSSSPAYEHCSYVELRWAGELP